MGLSRATGKVILADAVRVVTSDTWRCLQLKNGSFLCHMRVFLVVDGQETKITVDPPLRERPA